MNLSLISNVLYIMLSNFIKAQKFEFSNLRHTQLPARTQVRSPTIDARECWTGTCVSPIARVGWRISENTVTGLNCFICSMNGTLQTTEQANSVCSFWMQYFIKLNLQSKYSECKIWSRYLRLSVLNSVPTKKLRLNHSHFYWPTNALDYTKVRVKIYMYQYFNVLEPEFYI